MNTTSRIERLCRPLRERILASEVLAKRLARVETEDPGEQSLKGKERPMRVFAVRGLSDLEPIRPAGSV